MNREMVLYYTPADTPNVAKLKGILVRMGVRIKNISPEQTVQQIGYLAGLPGFEETKQTESADSEASEMEALQPEAGSAVQVCGQRRDLFPQGAEMETAICIGQTAVTQAAGTQTAARSQSVPPIPCEVLVMHNFTSRRIDELLLNLRKAGVPRIALKAVVTEHNSHWTFYHLYEEIKKEHEAMTPPAGGMERAGK